jgi:hypothetical protein
VEVVWRLTGGLAQELGVANTCREVGAADLATVLDRVDAAIVTPSTAVLECMLRQMPVALLDYTNRPLYVPAAWVISAPSHRDSVIPQLLDPPPARLLFQDAVLHDALECQTPAVPRAIRLIEEMVRVGRECRRAGRPLELPRRILADPQDGHQLPEEALSLRALHPTHEVFGDMDRAHLQAELGQTRLCLRRVEAENQQLVRRLMRTHVYERLEAKPIVGRALGGLRTVLSRLVRRRP